MTFLLECFAYVFAATLIAVGAIFVVVFWWTLGALIRRAIRYRSLSLALRELLS